MKVYINNTGFIPQTCGVSYVGHFSPMNVNYWEGVNPTIENFKAPKGAGWIIAGFTDNRPEYKEAYEQLKTKWPIVYQSPVRINTRTNRKLFFCIYDTKGKVK